MTAAARARRRVRLPIFLLSATAWAVLLSDAHVHSAVAHMALMTVAMMFPLAAAPVGHIHERTFVRRRRRAVFLFISGYAGVWTIAGCLLLPAAAIVPLTVVGGLVIVWQCSPFKQHCLNRGRSHPTVPAFGITADFAVLRFGMTHAVWCIGSCWPLMLLTFAASASRIELMVTVSVWMLVERIEPPRIPSWRPLVPVKVARSALFLASRPLTAIGSL